MTPGQARVAKRPCCSRCRHPGFLEGVAASGDGRPAFQCDKCGNYWTCGKNGGEFAGRGIGPLPIVACYVCGQAAVAYERCAAHRDPKSPGASVSLRMRRR